MIKAVIIDFDDTLCLTEAVCFAMENEVLQNMGRPPMSRETHRANWGVGLFDAISARSPGIDVEAFRKAYVPINAKYAKSGRLDAIPPANIGALDELIKNGKELVILTSREYDEMAHVLEPSHPLAPRINTFYYKENMKFHKPDPRAFAHIEEEHGWKPGECVYVGDSVTDAQAANGAGLKLIISLESGLRTKEDFKDYDVDSFIKSFPDVVGAVKSLEA